jgi:hypothetical protein
MSHPAVLNNVIDSLDSLPYMDISNELTYNQYCRLHDAYRSFTHESNQTKLNFNNPVLKFALTSSKDVFLQYKENPIGEGHFYDPLKQRVVSGLAVSLATDLEKVQAA